MKLVAILLPVLALSQTQTSPDKARFEGQVVNSVSGEPVRKARLTLRAKPHAQQTEVAPVTVGTDTAGKFEFKDIEPGAYELAVRRDGFADVIHGNRNGPAGTRDPIVLGRGDHKVGFTVKMTPYGVITGRVLDEDGDPIRNIQVAAMKYEYTSRGRELQESRSATTNDLGEYRIYDVPPGRYFVKTVPRGQTRIGGRDENPTSYTPLYYPGVAEPSAANAVEIAAGRQLSGIEFMLRKARYATIRGRVAAPAGATNVSVGLMTVTDRGSSSSTTSVNDKEGKFELIGVAPGQVYVLGSYVFEGQRHSAQLPIQVGSADITGIELARLLRWR